MHLIIAIVLYIYIGRIDPNHKWRNQIGVIERSLLCTPIHAWSNDPISGPPRYTPQDAWWPIGMTWFCPSGSMSHHSDAVGCLSFPAACISFPWMPPGALHTSEFLLLCGPRCIANKHQAWCRRVN